MLNIKAKLAEYARVLRIATKPTKEEFKISTKICSLGMLIIGLLGFAIFAIFVIIGI